METNDQSNFYFSILFRVCEWEFVSQLVGSLSPLSFVVVTATAQFPPAPECIRRRLSLLLTYCILM